MISYSNLGKRGHGRLGNQLFQIASVIGLAETFGTSAGFPEWGYERYFENKLPKGKSDAHFQETKYYYDISQFRSECDITGWLQSEKYFIHCREKIKEQFRFKKGLRSGEEFNNGKESIAVSVRRGDYINNPNYELLPVQYYLMALTKFDYTKYNLVFFSDDLEYCRLHFGCLGNAIFIDGSDIEQLCLMSMCDHFIIANSTFSWWGAWLGEKEYSIVIRPEYLFAGSLTVNDSKDFYPERWVKLDHKKERIDLKDTCFTIPVSNDSIDRVQNLELSIKYLKASFDCTIIIGEQGGNDFEYLGAENIYAEFARMELFHRTRMLNLMALISDCKVLVNWDADVFVSPVQILEAVRKIREKESDMVYPYDGRFARVPRTHHRELLKFVDVGILAGQHFKGMGIANRLSVGGAIFYSRKKFIEYGGENERFISYGAEDLERYYRFEKMGMRISRVRGVLYHLDHKITVNSSENHLHFKSNEIEWKRVRGLKDLTGVGGIK